MNDFLSAPRGAGLLAVLGLMSLPGCTPPPVAPVAASTTRLYAIDQAGAAKTCSVTPASLTAANLAPGMEAKIAMNVANDGGWCAITAPGPDTKPFAAGLLVGDPSHGEAYIHSVGDATRVDYTPDAGFTGADSFVVKLLPGSPILRVSVTVAAGPASVVAPPPPPAAPAAPSHPSRKKS